MKRLKIILLYMGAILLFLPGISVRAEETGLQQDIYEKSGAQELYDSLDGETRELLDSSGIDGGSAGMFPGKQFLETVSGLLREKLSGPLKSLAALLAVILLCRLAESTENSVGETASLVGAAACAALISVPILDLICRVQETVSGASVFLLAAVPVYAGLMVVSGDPTAGTSYSFLSLSAGNTIPVLASSVVFPALRLCLAVALASSVSRGRLDRLASSLYGFVKWALILVVTAYSGAVSIQTTLNARIDAAAAKTAKVITAAAVPIVGSAFGDAVGAIRNSLNVVRSGVGAFGLLASLCIFLPSVLETVLWIAVCGAGEIAADLLNCSGIGSFLKLCAAVVRMILAVLVSVFAVCAVTAAILIFAGGNA